MAETQMFKIVANPRAWWPVIWPGVSEEGGIVENRIEMRFILHSEDDHIEMLSESFGLVERAQATASKVAELRAAGDAEGAKAETILISGLYAEFVRKIACDWRGVGAENGEPLKWDDENLRMLMNMPGGVFTATCGAYATCRAGGERIREGN